MRRDPFAPGPSPNEAPCRAQGHTLEETRDGPLHLPQPLVDLLTGLIKPLFRAPLLPSPVDGSRAFDVAPRNGAGSRNLTDPETVAAEFGRPFLSPTGGFQWRLLIARRRPPFESEKSSFLASALSQTPETWGFSPGSVALVSIFGCGIKSESAPAHSSCNGGFQPSPGPAWLHGPLPLNGLPFVWGR